MWARIFSSWAPKVIALIGRLPDTLADRAIGEPDRVGAPADAVSGLQDDHVTARFTQGHGGQQPGSAGAYNDAVVGSRHRATPAGIISTIEGRDTWS